MDEGFLENEYPKKVFLHILTVKVLGSCIQFCGIRSKLIFEQSKTIITPSYHYFYLNEFSLIAYNLVVIFQYF